MRLDGALMLKDTEKYVRLKQAIYRDYSRSYGEDRKRFVTASALRERIASALGSLVPGLRLLDLGCGSGELLDQARRPTLERSSLVGLDLTPEMLALAKNRKLGRRVSLLQGNILDGLPFRSSSFHLITCLNLIQEIPTKAMPKLLEEMERILVPGGEVKAVIPCMTDDNASSRTFARLAREQGAINFGYVNDLKETLENGSGLHNKKYDLKSSPAAAAASRGRTRFDFFTKLQRQISDMGLDPSEVHQGVVFFSGNRSKV